MQKPVSFFGIGISLYGYKPRGDGTFEVILWITFLFLPVFPLSAWLIRPRSTEFIDLGAAFVESDRYDVIGKTNLNFGDILAAYLVGIAAVAPVLSVGYYFDTYVKPTFKPPMETWLLCLFVATAVWPAVVLYLANRRKDKAFEGKSETRIPH